jgi:S1-C subfamily serine protease
VTHLRLISSPWALITCALIAAASPARLPAETPASPPAPPAAPGARSLGNSEIEAQLETARHNLEQAANEVAQLSAQLSSTAIDEVMPLFEPGRAIIGVQLEPTGDGVGARVREVSPGGPAAKAGIRAGDVVVAVNGTPLGGAHPARQVIGVLHDVQPDSRVSVRVLRDGKSREFTLIARESPSLFGTWPEFAPALRELPGTFMVHRPLMDMELATLTPRLGSYFGTDKGVLVVRAPAGGALMLEDGDVILTIDGRQPTSGSHATRILGSYQPGEKVTLRIVRQRKTLELQGTLPDNPPPQREMMRQKGVRELPVIPNRNFAIFGNGAA